MSAPMKAVGVWSDDGLPALSDAAVGDVLARVGVPARPPGVEALDELFRAWLFSSPFHNLGLLAGLDGLAPPVAVADAVQHAFSGRGGPCHVQAAGFATLVRALGYSASLLPATVKERDDHLVVGVTVGGTRLLCDVGNGHPYPGPFPFDRPAERSWWGWSFATGPTTEGLRLLRSLPDGGQRQVYVARWEPRRYDDFARIIAAHHGSVGFGPFMTGLRAVRFTPRGMLALRDTRYERHTPFGLTVRPVLDAEACRALLAGPFGLQDAPVERALAGLARHRDLFAETVGEECPPGAPSAAFRVLFTVSTTDRPEGLRRLLGSLREALARDGAAEGAPVASRVEVLIVENSVRSEHRRENLRLVEAARAEGLGVSMDDDGRYGRSIARSRVRQTELVARYAATRGAPACVWMIDDDASFSTLSLRDGAEVSEPSVDVVSTILKIRASHPQVSAAVGPVTGDAQVRPEAMLRVQTFDLVENLRRVADLAPDAPWCTPDLSALTAMPDYYYDHSRSGTAHLTTPCAWIPRAPSGTVRSELLAYLHACLAIPTGGHATRPLLAQAPHAPIDTSSPLRGGNAVFFDLDACLSHPYPCASLGDIDSRRSDMIGATLLARGGFTFARIPVGLQHVRVEAEDSQHTAASRWRSLRSEFHGVLLARLVMDGVPPGIDPAAHLKRVAEGRAQGIAEALGAAHEQLLRLDELRRASRAWWVRDVEVTKALDRVASMLRAMWEQSVGSDAALPVSGRLTLLRQRLLDDGDLAAVLAAWRSTPGAIDAMREQMLGVRGGGR